MEEIKSRLQSLDGNSIGEKLKNLNKLIVYINETGYNERVNEIIDSYSATDDFEKLVKLRLTDSFQYAPGVLNVLKTGDLFYIPWVLKFKWFFSDKPGLLNHIEDFNNLLPYLSYTTRIKFIKKYALHLKTADKGEALYELLKRKYGLKFALMILPSCSEKFVRNILFSIESLVPSEICLVLFDVYPDLTVEYLRFLLKQKSGEVTNKRKARLLNVYDFESIVKKLASKNVTLFVQLIQDFNKLSDHVKFGKHIAKKIIKKEVDSVLHYPSQYLNILKIKHVTHMMSVEQIENLHLKLIPAAASQLLRTSPNRYCSFPNHITLLQNVSPNCREDILCKNFKKAYNKDLLECVEEWDTDFAELLPPISKEKWAELMIRNDYQNESDYICFMPFEKAIPKFKELIRTENDIRKRAYLIECMFRNLKLNGKLVEANELCDFVVKKHRNDNFCVRENVLKELISLDLHKLPSDVWDPMKELINLFALNNETDKMRPEILIFLKKWIHNRLVNNLPATEQLTMLLNTLKNDFDYVVAENTIYEKQCLLWFCDNLLKRSFESEEAKLKLVVALFFAVCKWNSAHKNDRFSPPVWLLKEIEQVLVGSGYTYWKSEICSSIKNDLSLKLLFYDKVYPNVITPSILHYMLDNKYDQILANIDSFIEFIFKENLAEYKVLFKKIRLSKWTGISRKIVTACQEDIESASSSRARGNKVFLLSILMSVEEFLKFLTPHLPAKSIIKNYSSKEISRYSLLTEVGKYLKNFSTPSLLLGTVRKFAVGDYLSLAVGSLDSISQRTAENIILRTLKEWLDCPVSLRKHVVRAYCKIAPLELASSFLTEVFERENNVSLRIVYFNQAFSLFKWEPTPETWAFLVRIVNQLKPTDNKVLDTIFNTAVIPQDFLSEHIERLWELIQKMDLKEAQLIEYKRNVIKMIDQSLINVVHDKFCDHLISLLYVDVNEKDSAFQESLNNFAVNYLLCSNSQEILIHRLRKVQSAIQSVVTKDWSKLSFEGNTVCLARELLYSFIQTLSNESCSRCSLPHNPIEVIGGISSFLSNMLEESDFFEGFLHLRFALIYHNSKQIGEGQHFSLCISRMSNAIDECCSSYGGEVLPFIVDIMENSLYWFSDDTPAVMKHLRASEILLQSSSKYSKIVALKLLPEKVSKVENCKNDYLKILDMASKVSDPSVKLYLNKYYLTLHENRFY